MLCQVIAKGQFWSNFGTILTLSWDWFETILAPFAEDLLQLLNYILTSISYTLLSGFRPYIYTNTQRQANDSANQSVFFLGAGGRGVSLHIITFIFKDIFSKDISFKEM